MSGELGMLRASRMLVKMAVNHGLGVVLAILVTVWSGGIVVYVIKDGARREAKLQEIIQVDLRESRTVLASLVETLHIHDDRAREYITTSSSTNQQLSKALVQLAQEMRELRFERRQ